MEWNVREPQVSVKTPIIGLTGGIGAGKSAVARMMVRLGATVLDADQTAHDVLADLDVVETLRDWWGDSVVGNDGRIDRQRVAQIVFEEVGQRRRLEALIHPRILARWAEVLERCQGDPSVTKAVVIDAPLLFESGADEYCDVIVFVEVREEVRARRVEETRGWSLEELQRREKLQKSLDFKKDNADYTVENNSSESDLRRCVERVFSTITSSSR